MELRDIEVFLTLADELHFGRTAERLHVSVARVSQAIKKQERSVGAELFERNSRNVRLTPVGQQLRTDLLPLYEGLRSSMARARLAAKGKSEVLRVGLIPSSPHVLKPIFDAFRARHPQYELQFRHNPFIDSFAPVRRGDIDVLIAWLPVEEPGLTVGPVILSEPRVLTVAPDHRLAERDSVSMDVFGAFDVPGAALTQPDYWEDAFMPFYTPKGSPIIRGPKVANMDDVFNYVGAGETIQLLAAHAAKYHIRPDVVYLPVLDADPLRWGLVWRSDIESEPVRALADLVRELGTLEPYR